MRRWRAAFGFCVVFVVVTHIPYEGSHLALYRIWGRIWCSLRGFVFEVVSYFVLHMGALILQCVVCGVVCWVPYVAVHRLWECISCSLWGLVFGLYRIWSRIWCRILRSVWGCLRGIVSHLGLHLGSYLAFLMGARMWQRIVYWVVFGPPYGAAYRSWGCMWCSLWGPLLGLYRIWNSIWGRLCDIVSFLESYLAFHMSQRICIWGPIRGSYLESFVQPAPMLDRLRGLFLESYVYSGVYSGVYVPSGSLRRKKRFSENGTCSSTGLTQQYQCPYHYHYHCQ